MIGAIRFVNFQGFEDATFEPEPGVNLVISYNGKGKTTTRVGAEFLFAGRASGYTDERGGGAEGLIRHGAKQAVVEAKVVTADGEAFGVRRTLYASSTPTKLDVEGCAGNTTALEEILRDRIAADPDVVSAALNASRIVDMAPANQQSLILRLAGAKWTAEQIAAALESPRARRALALIGCDKLAGGPEVLAQIEKRAREARPQEKKARDTLLGELRAVPDLHQVTEAVLQGAEERMAAAKAERDGLQQQAGAALLAASARRTAAGRRERLQNEIAALQAKIDHWSANCDVERAKAEEETATAAHAAAQANLTALHQERTATQADADKWQAALESLGEAHDGDCPFCVGIKCGLQADAAREAIGSALTEATELLAEVDSDLKKAQARFAAIAKVAAEYTDARRIAEGSVAALEAGREDMTRKVAALAEVEAEIKTPADAGNAEDITARVEALDLAIERDRELLATHRRALDAEERRKGLDAKVKAAEGRVTDLEDLCAEFGTKGTLRQRLMAGVVDPFLARVNEALAGVSDATLSLGDDGGIQLQSPQWEGSLRPGDLARSMRLRVGVALQYALCAAAGWRLLLIDDADALDYANRNLLLQTCLEIAPHIGQIIVLAAQPTEGLPPDPGIEGLAFWTIADGQFVRLQPAPAESGVA